LDTNLFIKMIKASNKNHKFDMPYYSFIPKKGYRVIVLDSIITDEVTTQGIIDDEQYKWLKKELDRAKNDTVLIFMHVPLIEPFPSPSHRLRNSTAIMSLLESYNNPIGVFQGHYHAAKITQRNNVLYVNTPALVSYPNAFRSVNVTNYRDKVVFEFGWHETRETTIQKMAKILVLVSSIYTGEEKDQSGTYEIMK
ncbi:metallophosphoesterase, partial [bacterium]|nr:metallophosphoesterase [bacterium]